MTLSNRIAQASLPLFGGVVFGGTSAATTAFAGGIGAAILNSAGHDGYIPIEAAQMGAAGGAVLGGSVGVLAGTMAACGLFGGSDESNKSNSQGALCGYVSSTVVTGLVGYAIMNTANQETGMPLAQTAASFAVGGAVTMLPAGCALICIATPFALAIAAYVTKQQAASQATPNINTLHKDELDNLELQREKSLDRNPVGPVQ